MNIIHFCTVSRDGVHYRSTTDRRTTGKAAILMPISAGVLEHIGFYTFISMIRATELDSELSLLELDRRGEVKWSLLPGDNLWIPYEWDSVRLFALRPSVSQSKRRHGPDGLYIDPVGESSSVTADTWRQKLICFRYCTETISFGAIEWNMD